MIHPLDALTKQPLRKAEEAAVRQREFWDQVSINRSVGVSEPALRQLTFAGDKGYNPEIRIA